MSKDFLNESQERLTGKAFGVYIGRVAVLSISAIEREKE